MSLRVASRLALNSPRLLAVAAAVVAAELVVRVVVAMMLSTVGAIVFPPVVLVVGAAGLASGARKALAGDSPESVAAWWTRPPIVPAVGVAVGGHAIALTVGTSIFLAVDTAIRMGLYWTGNGGLITAEVVLLAPIAGIAFGTVVAWGVVAPAVAWVADGATARAALRRALVVPVAAPRRASVGAAWQVGVAFALSGVTVLAFALRLGTDSTALALAFGGVTWLFVGSFGLGILLPAHLDRADPALDQRIDGPGIRRVVLAVVLVLGAIGGASAIRLTEAHPPPDRASLPDDPDEMYATALTNTERSNLHYRVDFRAENESEQLGFEWGVDRGDRQIRVDGFGKAAGPYDYHSAGTSSPPRYDIQPGALTPGLRSLTLGSRFVKSRHLSVAAFPGYFGISRTSLLDRFISSPSLPVPDGWRVADRSEGRVVLALTDPEAVWNFTTGAWDRAIEVDRLTAIETARVQVVIDTETGTLRRYEADFNATVHDDRYELKNGSSRQEQHTEATFSVGTDVERPDELGSRSPWEWYWKLMAY